MGGGGYIVAPVGGVNRGVGEGCNPSARAFSMDPARVIG
jgi:hypothetical protein